MGGDDYCDCHKKIESQVQTHEKMYDLIGSKVSWKVFALSVALFVTGMGYMLKTQIDIKISLATITTEIKNVTKELDKLEKVK